MKLHGDTRGASIAITHALAIGITAVLIAGLLVSTGDFLQNHQRTAAREQLDDVAGDVVDKINELDRLNETGESVTARVEPSYPETVAGEPYTLELRTGGGPGGTLVVDSPALDRPVRQEVATTTPLMADTSVRGGQTTVALCRSEHVRLGECS